MKLLKVIKDYAKDPGITETQLSLITKKGKLALEISNREHELKIIKDSAKITKPARLLAAKEALNDAILNSNTPLFTFVDAFLAVERLTKKNSEESQEVQNLKKELDVLKRIYESFPSDDEIEKLET